MNLKLTLASWTLTIIISCTGSKEHKQEILDQDKMANVMYDVLLAESFVESYLMKDTTLDKDSLLKVEMDKVLKVYGITSKIFSESYLYYKAHPVQLETVMDSAHERAVRGRTDIFIRRTPNRR
ncbi:MAG: DUF4296 domain-containing protein [Chitinophagaceae bacterium]|jgi:hypothetical protein